MDGVDGWHWLSGHIFFESDDVTVCDHFIREVVAPFVREGVTRELLNSYFLVRYAELGPHVRVRVRITTRTQQDVEALLEEYVGERFPDPLLSWPVGKLPQAARRSAHKSLFWVPYVPELNRYGGSEGLEVAESFFRGSTDFALRLLDQIESAGLDRNGVGLAAMVTLLGSMTRDLECVETASKAVSDMNAPRSLEAMFERGFAHQAAALTSQVTRCWEAVMEGRLPQPLSDYAEASLKTKACLQALVAAGRLLAPTGVPVMSISQAVEMLAPSYIHMTNNRLGLSNITEGFLRYAIRQAFRSQQFLSLRAHRRHL